MNLLLDTHVLIWWMQGSERIGDHAKAALFDAGAQVWLSAASVWEMAIKSALGKLDLGVPLEEAVPMLTRRGGRCLPVSIRHALEVAALPMHHGDPFDRILIAQARVEGLTLVTADAALSEYDVRILEAS